MRKIKQLLLLCAVGALAGCGGNQIRDISYLELSYEITCALSDFAKTREIPNNQIHAETVEFEKHESDEGVFEYSKTMIFDCDFNKLVLQYTEIETQNSAFTSYEASNTVTYFYDSEKGIVMTSDDGYVGKYAIAVTNDTIDASILNNKYANRTEAVFDYLFEYMMDTGEETFLQLSSIEDIAKSTESEFLPVNAAEDFKVNYQVKDNGNYVVSGGGVLFSKVTSSYILYELKTDVYLEISGVFAVEANSESTMTVITRPTIEDEGVTSISKNGSHSNISFSTNVEKVDLTKYLLVDISDM